MTDAPTADDLAAEVDPTELAGLLTEAAKTDTQVAIRGEADHLAIRPEQRFWTRAQIAAFAAIGLDKVPAPNLIAFFHQCKESGLDPFRREAYLIGRRQWVGKGQPGADKDGYAFRYTSQTGIDGFRHIGQRTGRYIGTDVYWTGDPTDPEWFFIDRERGVRRTIWSDIWPGGTEHPPFAAKAVVHYVTSEGRVTKVEAVAHYAEFVASKTVFDGYGENRKPRRGPDGREVKEPSGQWGVMPAHMTAKVSEALAFRRAFPREAGGWYEHAELAAADASADDAARSARAEARREATAARRAPAVEATPTEPGDPSTEADEIVVVEPVDRERLLVEVAAQADALSQTPQEYTARWTLTHRKPYGEADDDELRDLLAAGAPFVAAKLAEAGEDQAAEAAARMELAVWLGLWDAPETEPTDTQSSASSEGEPS